MEQTQKAKGFGIASVASMVVGVVPVFVLANWWDVPTKITVGYGVVVWVVAVLLKTTVHHFIVDRYVGRGADRRAISVLQGFLSASTELGVAAIFLVYFWQPETFSELVGLGVGAGMAEAVILPIIKNPLEDTSLELHMTEVQIRSRGNSVVQRLSVLERILATVLHVSSRALVYLTILSANPLPAIIAVVGFSCVDGVAYYGHLNKWRFDSVRVLTGVYGFIGGIAVVLVVVLLCFMGLFHAPA